MEIKFWVEGTPVAQGSKNGFVRNGRVVMVESAGKRLKVWREQIATRATQEAATVKQLPLDEPVSVTLEFKLQKPKSKTKYGMLAYTAPDLDKLVRAVLDGLTGPLLKNDSRVVDIVATKRYSVEETGVQICIKNVSDQVTLFDE